MSVSGIIVAGRRAADREMVDTVQVLRPSPRGVLDEVTLAHRETFTQVYSGRARVKSLGSIGSGTVDFGDAPITIRGYVATLPWDAPEILPEDRLRVTASADPQIGARDFRVASVEVRTVSLFRHLTLEDDDV